MLGRLVWNETRTKYMKIYTTYRSYVEIDYTVWVYLLEKGRSHSRVLKTYHEFGDPCTLFIWVLMPTTTRNWRRRINGSDLGMILLAKANLILNMETKIWFLGGFLYSGPSVTQHSLQIYRNYTIHLVTNIDVVSYIYHLRQLDLYIISYVNSFIYITKNF